MTNHSSSQPQGVRLEVRGVDKRYGARSVLHKADLVIEPGEFVAIVGRSGCGKSTLLKLLAGKEQPDSGELHIPEGWHSAMLSPEPYVITSASPDDVTGTLTLISDATSLAYFDGQDYQVLEEVEAVDGQLTVDLDIKPWSRQVTIVRDDLKGETQDVTLYLVGPFLPLK